MNNDRVDEEHLRKSLEKMMHEDDIMARKYDYLFSEILSSKEGKNIILETLNILDNIKLDKGKFKMESLYGGFSHRLVYNFILSTISPTGEIVLQEIAVDLDKTKLDDSSAKISIEPPYQGINIEHILLPKVNLLNNLLLKEEVTKHVLKNKGYEIDIIVNGQKARVPGGKQIPNLYRRFEKEIFNSVEYRTATNKIREELNYRLKEPEFKKKVKKERREMAIIEMAIIEMVAIFNKWAEYGTDLIHESIKQFEIEQVLSD